MTLLCLLKVPRLGGSQTVATAKNPLYPSLFIARTSLEVAAPLFHCSTPCVSSIGLGTGLCMLRVGNKPELEQKPEYRLK